MGRKECDWIVCRFVVCFGFEGFKKKERKSEINTLVTRPLNSNSDPAELENLHNEVRGHVITVTLSSWPPNDIYSLRFANRFLNPIAG